MAFFDGKDVSLAMDGYILVVGALNIDIGGLAGRDYQPKDSNPGKVKISLGGVGHNIAQNLLYLGVPVRFWSWVGSDALGELASQLGARDGFPMEHVERVEGMPTSTYLYLNDGEGDLVSAVNDMSLLEGISPQVLSLHRELLDDAALVVLDANLPKESIAWLCEKAKVPLFVDPVSVHKAGRLLEALPGIDTIKPNALEASFLSGVEVVDEESGVAAARRLCEMGVKNAFVSLGEKGMAYASSLEAGIVKPNVTRILSTNGAGDAGMAAIIYSRFALEERSLEKVARIAQAASGLKMESAEGTTKALTAKALLERVREQIGGME